MPELAGYVAGPGQGAPGESPDVKATAAFTAGALTVLESVTGQGPPRHVHDREDECFYVLAGTVTGSGGDDAFTAARAASSSCRAGGRTRSTLRARPGCC